MVTPAQLPDWLRRLYPFEPKTFDCGPGGMSYVNEGPRVDEAVLLVHGNPTWSFHFRELIGQLVKAGRRCVAPDHLGMGLSDKPADYPYCLESHIANLTKLVASLGLRRVDLVVHDWGGAIGFGWAVRHPEPVGRIVMMNTAAFPAPRMPLRIRLCRTPWIGEALIRGFNGFAGMATWMTMKRRRLTPEVKRGYVFPYDSWGNRVAVAGFVADIPMGPEHPTLKVLEEMAAGLGQFRNRPIRIIWGGADFCFNDWFFRRWQQIYPDAEAQHLADVGHYVLEDAGDEVMPEIVRFLGKEEPAPRVS